MAYLKDRGKGSYIDAMTSPVFGFIYIKVHQGGYSDHNEVQPVSTGLVFGSIYELYFYLASALYLPFENLYIRIESKYEKFIYCGCDLS